MYLGMYAQKWFGYASVSGVQTPSFSRNLHMIIMILPGALILSKTGNTFRNANDSQQPDMALNLGSGKIRCRPLASVNTLYDNLFFFRVIRRKEGPSKNSNSAKTITL